MRGIARRSTGERGYDVLACADLALVAAASARDAASWAWCQRRESGSKGGGGTDSIGAARGVARASVG